MRHDRLMDRAKIWDYVEHSLNVGKWRFMRYIVNDS